MFCLQVLFNILFKSGGNCHPEYKQSSWQTRTIHLELDGTVWAEQLYVLCVIQEYVFTSWQWQTLLWTPQSQVSALNSLPWKCNSMLNCARFEGFYLKFVARTTSLPSCWAGAGTAGTGGAYNPRQSVIKITSEYKQFSWHRYVVGI